MLAEMTFIEQNYDQVLSPQLSIGATRSQWDFGVGDVAQIYQTLFWKPFLGSSAWSLYESLKTAVISVAAGWTKLPSINELAAMLGAGDRYTILGRSQTKTRPAQKGTIDILQKANLVLVHKSGSDRRRQYHFGVVPLLPILTPLQAGQLPASLVSKHDHYLGSIHVFDLRAWRRIDHESFVSSQVASYGRMWLGTDPYPYLSPTPPISQTSVQRMLCLHTTCQTCGVQNPTSVFPVAPGQSVYLIAVCDMCAAHLNGRSPTDAHMILRPSC